MLTATSTSDTAARIAAQTAADAVKAAQEAACRRREAAADAQVLLKDINRLVRQIEARVAVSARRRRFKQAVIPLICIVVIPFVAWAFSRR